MTNQKKKPPKEDDEISRNFVAFTASIYGTESKPTTSIDQCGEDKLTCEDLEESYVHLFKKWEVLLKAHGIVTTQNSVHETNIKILKTQLT